MGMDAYGIIAYGIEYPDKSEDEIHEDVYNNKKVVRVQYCGICESNHRALVVPSSRIKEWSCGIFDPAKLVVSQEDLKAFMAVINNPEYDLGGEPSWLLIGEYG